MEKHKKEKGGRKRWIRNIFLSLYFYFHLVKFAEFNSTWMKTNTNTLNGN